MTLLLGKSEAQHNSSLDNAGAGRRRPEDKVWGGRAWLGWGRWAADTESIKVCCLLFQLNNVKFGLNKAYITILRRLCVVFGICSDSGALPE